MPVSSNVFLVGPMGSGKSAVGRQLARLLALPFVDADAEIERRTGVDIATYSSAKASRVSVSVRPR